MKENFAIDAINHIDQDLVEEYAKEKEHLKRKRENKKKSLRITWGAAACVCLIVSIVIILNWPEKEPTVSLGLRQYKTFEETLCMATDVVIAKYQGSELAGNEMMLHKFAVSESVYGDASGVLDIYITQPYITVTEDATAVGKENTIVLSRDTDYMLVLEKADAHGVYTRFVPYIMMNETIINVDSLADSQMYGESIVKHSTGISFTNELSKEALINYVKSITSKNIVTESPTAGYIKSNNISDIIAESPNVIKIKVDKLNYTTKTDWLSIDMYQCTVTESIKGDIAVGEKIAVTFFADTVKAGEECIVAVKVINEDAVAGDMSPVCHFTSKSSLFDLSKYQEIKDMVKS